MFTPIRRTLAGLAIAVVAVAGAAACRRRRRRAGLDPTITGSGQAITGTSGDDVIIGTNGAEVINGTRQQRPRDLRCRWRHHQRWPGNDVIDGGSGTDRASYATAASPVVVNLATGSATVGGTA